ncbi:hypothetical protein DAI22_03g161100 [Oryza sativa Japonica Group]|nr:hypothetical protein DAI22_03g161100 [Oryza sativa Japonica Group]
MLDPLSSRCTHWRARVRARFGAGNVTQTRPYPRASSPRQDANQTHTPYPRPARPGNPARPITARPPVIARSDAPPVIAIPLPSTRAGTPPRRLLASSPRHRQRVAAFRHQIDTEPGAHPVLSSRREEPIHSPHSPASLACPPLA